MEPPEDERLARARQSLEGLSVGDAFGEQFFRISPQTKAYRRETHTPPPGTWRFTDDTNMALSIVSILRQYGAINQEELALSFARRYDPARGYGMAMHHLLRRIQDGEPWSIEARSLFGGQGSFGNGSAMRVAPVGAFFADDLVAVIDSAGCAAEVTHTHPEAAAGAIAISVATAWAWRLSNSDPTPSRRDFLDCVLPHVPNSDVRSGIRRARDLTVDTPLTQVVATLGNGSQVSCQDTVPFVLWCAGEHLDSYEEALWLAARAGGDMDTTCAMVGGIVVMYTGVEDIPAQWRESREPLPDWPFTE